MNLQFAQPQFFWLLALLPVFAGLKVLADLRGRRMLNRAAAPRLQQKLLTSGPRWQGWTATGLELGAFFCLTATLARPQMGFVEEEVTTSGRSLLFALDTSRSMLATDLKPDRLTRTKLTITDLVRQMPGDRIGLIAFAGKAFLQAPITQDHDALLETLDQCDSEIIPRGGSNLAEAIDLAIETFTGKRLDGDEKEAKPAPATSQALLVFTDGEELEGKALEAAHRAADNNVTIISVGVGTLEGGIMPDPDRNGRDYIKDNTGKIVKTALQAEILEAVARATQGLYVPLSQVTNDQQLKLVLNKLNSSSNTSKTMKRAIERYRWPLSTGLLLLLATQAVRIARSDRFRRLSTAGSAQFLAVLAMLHVIPAFPIHAESGPAQNQPGPLEQLRRDAKSWQSRLKPDQYRAALHKFVNSGSFLTNKNAAEWAKLGEGALAYAQGDFDTAVASFGKSLLGDDPKLLEQSHFNLANTLFQRAGLAASNTKEAEDKALSVIISTLENCLEQYVETLAINGNHQEAAANKKTVEDLLKQLKQQQQQQQKQQQGKSGNKGEQKDGQSGESGEGQEGEGSEGKEGEKSGQQKDGKEGEQKEGQQGKDGKDGQNGDQPKDDKGKAGKDGEKKEDGRSEEQKAKEKAAQEASNQQQKGKVEAAGEGNKSGEPRKAQVANHADDKVNEKTGFSRTEARRNIQRFGDEVQVRPQIEKGPMDRPFKNW